MSDAPFAYNPSVEYYLRNGWKLLSPLICMCPVCQSALIQNDRFDFCFCVPCETKVIRTTSGKAMQLTESMIEKATEVQENGQAGKQCHPKQQSEQQDKTSELLLQHWKMTNYMCPEPECYSPLMEQPGSCFLLCGKCGYQSTTQNEDLCSIECSIDPKTLAEAIVKNVEERISDGKDANPEQDMHSANNSSSERTEHEERVEEELYLLNEKILEAIDEVLSPNNFEELRALHQRLEAFKVAKELLVGMLHE